MHRHPHLVIFKEALATFSLELTAIGAEKLIDVFDSVIYAQFAAGLDMYLFCLSFFMVITFKEFVDGGYCYGNSGSAYTEVTPLFIILYVGYFTTMLGLFARPFLFLCCLVQSCSFYTIEGTKPWIFLIPYPWMNIPDNALETFKERNKACCRFARVAGWLSSLSCLLLLIYMGTYNSVEYIKNVTNFKCFPVGPSFRHYIQDNCKAGEPCTECIDNDICRITKSQILFDFSMVNIQLLVCNFIALLDFFQLVVITIMCGHENDAQVQPGSSQTTSQAQGSP